MKKTAVNKGAVRLASGGLVLFALVAPLPLQGAAADDQTLQAAITTCSNDIFADSPEKRIIIDSGPRAANAILDAIQTVHWRSGGLARKGTVPTARPEPINAPYALLRLLDQVDAPLPVDRLCGLVEMGVGQNYGESLDAILDVLASSGHPRGLAYIRYHRELATRSASTIDKLWLPHLDTFIRKWQAANMYIHDGQPPTEQFEVRAAGKMVKKPYVPSVATKAARKLYQENSKSLDWDGNLESKYLEARFKAVFPLLRDPEKSIMTDFQFLGRFYEPYLAPLILDWVEGRKEPFETAFGGRPTYPNASGLGSEMLCITFLTYKMTGDTALKIKWKLLQGARSGDWRSLEYHNPDLWLTDALKMAPTDAAMASVVLKTMATQERPFTEQEKDALPRLLVQRPVETAQYSEEARDGDPEWRMVNLAKREPKAFVKAFGSKHLSIPVVHAGWKAGIFKDSTLVFEKIEYGMLHDYDTNIGKKAPEKIASLPPAIREKLQARMDKSASPRINAKWLQLVATDFSNNPETLSFLKRLSENPDFRTAKREIDNQIAQFNRAHPDLK